MNGFTPIYYPDIKTEEGLIVLCNYYGISEWSDETNMDNLKIEPSVDNMTHTALTH